MRTEPRVGCSASSSARPSTWPETMWPPSGVADAQRRLEVDALADLPAGRPWSPPASRARLRPRTRPDRSSITVRQTPATAMLSPIAQRDRSEPGGADGHAPLAAGARLDGADLAHVLDDSGEHAVSLPSAARLPSRADRRRPGRTSMNRSGRRWSSDCSAGRSARAAGIGAEQARRQVDDQLVDQARRPAARRRAWRPPPPTLRWPAAPRAAAAPARSGTCAAPPAGRISTRAPAASSAARRAGSSSMPNTSDGPSRSKMRASRRAAQPAVQHHAQRLARRRRRCARSCAGSSPSTVPTPVRTTELRARNSCTSWRAGVAGDPAARAVGQRACGRRG